MLQIFSTTNTLKVIKILKKNIENIIFFICINSLAVLRVVNHIKNNLNFFKKCFILSRNIFFITTSLYSKNIFMVFEKTFHISINMSELGLVMMVVGAVWWWQLLLCVVQHHSFPLNMYKEYLYTTHVRQNECLALWFFYNIFFFIFLKIYEREHFSILYILHPLETKKK